MHDNLNQKFYVTFGETGGSKQICWYAVSKATLADLIAEAQIEFPGVPFDKLYLLPGMGDVLTPATSLEVPST